MIKLKRVYEAYEESDGYRILVDRLWPRGVSKADAKIDEWVKDIAPSSELRKWYAHEVPKWPEFKRRYFIELQGAEILVRDIVEKQKNRIVTFVYGAKDTEHNQAFALKEYIEDKMSKDI